MQNKEQKGEIRKTVKSERDVGNKIHDNLCPQKQERENEKKKKPPQNNI